MKVVFIVLFISSILINIIFFGTYKSERTFSTSKGFEVIGIEYIENSVFSKYTLKYQANSKEVRNIYIIDNVGKYNINSIVTFSKLE